MTLNLQMLKKITVGIFDGMSVGLYVGLDVGLRIRACAGLPQALILTLSHVMYVCCKYVWTSNIIFW